MPNRILWAKTGGSGIARRPMLKVGLVGSKKDYPAFDSLLSILRGTLGENQVIELRIKDWLPGSPSALKFFLKTFQDLILNVKIMSCYRKENINTLLLFQVYYPLALILSKLVNLKSIIFIGGSGFYWSYLEHSSIIDKLSAYANLPTQNFCHKFADLLITLSTNMVEMIGIEKCKHKTRFALPRLDKRFYSHFEIAKKFEDRDLVVGFVGSFYRRKGISNLIQAIPSIIDEKGDCRFLLIGGGPLLNSIKREAHVFEIGKAVKITGYVDYNDLPQYYNEMKLYVLPAYAEGIPSTIFEAMGCGAPVLAARVGGIPGIIKDGETGFLLESNDPKHIAQRIIGLLNSPKLLEKVSMNAYENVRKNFSEGKVMDSWRRILENLAR